MNDPILNCITEVCCGEQEAEQMLAQALIDDGGDPKEARKNAAFIKKHFDLAERGTLKASRQSVARLARGRSGSQAGE